MISEFMDIQTARTFLAAASTGSFLAASKRIHASPSTVTERIKQLEHLLGTRLFVRDKRGCSLTPAGRRFVETAQALVRVWDHGRARLALPSRFRSTIRIGGQHALWPSLLIPWLQAFKEANPDLALIVSAGTPGQLNRALEEEDLDIAFLYDPILRKGIRVERIASDRLVMVTAEKGLDWRDNFVRINWSESTSLELTGLLGDLPASGFELDLGVLSLNWLVSTGGCGFVPERLARPLLREGRLSVVEAMPTLDFSPFACWRASVDEEVVSAMISSARERMNADLG